MLPERYIPYTFLQNLGNKMLLFKGRRKEKMNKFLRWSPLSILMDFLKLPESMGGMGTISHETQLHEVSFS